MRLIRFFVLWRTASCLESHCSWKPLRLQRLNTQGEIKWTSVRKDCICQLLQSEAAAALSPQGETLRVIDPVLAGHYNIQCVEVLQLNLLPNLLFKKLFVLRAVAQINESEWSVVFWASTLLRDAQLIKQLITITFIYVPKIQDGWDEIEEEQQEEESSQWFNIMDSKSSSVVLYRNIKCLSLHFND